MGDAVPEASRSWPAADAEILTPRGARVRRRAPPRARSRAGSSCSSGGASAQAELDAGALPDFLPDTRASASGDWRVAPAPADLQDRRVEITGPVDRKMMINALNSGAQRLHGRLRGRLLADLGTTSSTASATSADAVRGTIALDDGRARATGSDDETGRRSWSARAAGTCPSGTCSVDGEPVSASLFDFGLDVLPQRRASCSSAAAGPYFYLPKLESHLEARLWNDAFALAEDELGLPRGTIRATVLIETILAAFEMDEILYELREHACRAERRPLGLHLQRDQEVRPRPEFVLPDRAQVDDDRAVHARLHRAARAHLPPARRARDRRHGRVHPVAPRPRGQRGRARQGRARTRSARPATASTAPGSRTPTSSRSRREVFDAVLGERPNQLERLRDDVVT